MNVFADYKREAHRWITLISGEYYPDILLDACALYTPVQVLFGQLLKASESSIRLFLSIAQIQDSWMRIQLARVFRKYVSPNTPVEMLKKRSKAEEICQQFGKEFRPIHEVQLAFDSRPIPDEALCALLWEYKSRGQKGYDLTERFFALFQAQFPELRMIGPQRAGQDIRAGNIFKNYPNPKRALDFVIYDTDGQTVLAIGLARYDGDRGGAQEDDRVGGYQNCADEFLQFATQIGLSTKVLFINDGPGLLLGSMWDDYARIEASWSERIQVMTLRMIEQRLSIQWLRAL